MRTLTKIIVVVGAFLFLFIASMVWLFAKYQCVPDTLIVAVLGSGTGELILTALIEIFKTKWKGGESPQPSQEEKGDIGL